MDQQTKQQHFLSRAEEAQQLATKARSPDARDRWLKLAQGYRDLAFKLGGIGKL